MHNIFDRVIKFGVYDNGEDGEYNDAGSGEISIYLKYLWHTTWDS